MIKAAATTVRPPRYLTGPRYGQELVRWLAYLKAQFPEMGTRRRYSKSRAVTAVHAVW